MSNDKHTNDIVAAVKQNDAYVNALADLPDSERGTVEATVEEFATMMSPLVSMLDELEQSEEVMIAVRARLSEKLRAG